MVLQNSFLQYSVSNDGLYYVQLLKFTNEIRESNRTKNKPKFYSKSINSALERNMSNSSALHKKCTSSLKEKNAKDENSKYRNSLTLETL